MSNKHLAAAGTFLLKKPNKAEKRAALAFDPVSSPSSQNRSAIASYIMNENPTHATTRPVRPKAGPADARPVGKKPPERQRTPEVLVGIHASVDVLSYRSVTMTTTAI